jgi:alpha-1,2-mannosyltransferase
MKIYPGILLLVMLSLRTFRPTAFKAILIGAVLPVLLLPVIPSSLYFGYFLDALPHLSGQSLINLDNQSITAALGRLSFPIEQWPRYQIVQTTFPIRLVNLTAAFLLVGLMVWRGATVRAADRDQEVSIALCALACVPLFSPQGWGHAFVFSMPLVAFLAVFDPRPTVRILAVLCWLALLVPSSHVFRWLEQLPMAAGTLLYSSYVLAVSAAILLTLLLPVWRPRENLLEPLIPAKSPFPVGRR